MPDGHTRLEHYQAAGTPQEDWGVPLLPPGMAYLWGWFAELASARSSGGLAANPISWEAMQAYFTFIGERPAIADLDAIRLLDRMSLSDHSKKGAKNGR